VMDALGIERSAVMAQADGVAVACLFAATNPERLSHLVLISGSARMLADEDYPCGLPAEDVEAALASLERDWGDSSAPAGIDLLTPSRAHDPAWRRTLARIQRLSCPPAAARAHWESAVLVDVRGILAAVQTRTLLVHSRYDRLFPFEQGRWLAGHLPDARLLELDHLDHLFPGAAAPEVVEFITGERPHVSADNALVTVLFTDIVGSTRSAAAAGDEEWRLTLDRHDAMTRRQIVRHGGREIKSTGDGFLATFTGPAGAIEAACAIRDGATALGIDLRAGLHTGIVELRAEDLAGTAVNLAARVMACAGPCEVMVSRTVVDLLAGSNFVFADRGSRELKGLSGSWQLFAVE